MAPTAGAGQFWYWDQVENKQWWPQFASVSGFLKTTGPVETSGGASGLSTLTPAVTSAGTPGDLSFTPTGGWGPFTRSAVSVPFGGAAPDLSGLSIFFQGTGHKNLRPQPITFRLNCPAPCQFSVQIGTVAKSGAHPLLMVNAKAAAETNFPAFSKDHDAAQTLTVDLAAGPQQVTLDNTGPDWFIVQRFVVTHYAPPIAVLAKGSRRSALFWAYNRDRTGASPATATLHLPGMVPGAYTVHLWDTWTGQPLTSIKAAVQNGSLSVPLPPITRDIAGSVTPR